MRLTIDEYSKHFKMSKEMINSKLKAKKLNFIIENTITYIIVPDKKETISKQLQTVPQETLKHPTVIKHTQKNRTTVATILSLYQRENQQLKEKIIQLETKIDKLVDDKEQMLRDERDKIEEVYSAKDEQLKNILELINAKLKLEQPIQMVHEVESYETQEEVKLKKQDRELVELRAYLKNLDMKSYKKKIIKKRFLAAYENDIRVIQQNGKLYLDFSKYDYSDLLAY